MRAPSQPLALLDTNVLIHIARNDATGQRIEAKYSLTQRPDRPLLSTIVEAELFAFARYNKWGERKQHQLEQILAQLVRVGAGHPAIVQAYADLYCAARTHGRYSETRQNDLWIAATAKATGAELYTCNEKHFAWMAPQHLTVRAIQQNDNE